MSFNFKQSQYAGLVMLSIAFTLPFWTMGGGVNVTSIISCNNPSSLEQCGFSSCTLTSGGIAPYVCTKTITFNPPFASVPTYMSAQWAGCANGVCHYETFTAIPIATMQIQSDSGETWAAMPVASTEIYGTPNHETSILMPQSVNNAYFNVLCIKGSTSATAKLQPQYSIDGGNTWHELATNTGTLDALVDATDCSFTSNGVEAVTVGPSAIPDLHGNVVQFRVVGFNGSGAGDSVTFNNISIVLAIKFTNVIFTCIGGTVASSDVCADTSNPSKTSMTVVVSSRDAPGGWVEAFYWIAQE